MITTALRILLVEDNEADILITSRTIGKIVEQPHIEVAETLEEVRYQMVNFIPDVVISDYNLPACNGLEVLELVQKFDKSVPFIFLTGTVNDEELAANTILAGAWGYVLKKHMDVLEEKLRPLLKKVVFHLNSRDEVRERLRKNKMAINQIYDYLDHLRSDNKEQKDNIGKIKDTLQRFKMDEDD
ncbi:MAG TPA: response regulator [Salinimicrobium catena]|uniref:Response regulator n=1 Tax=Salinimicrobium catena TaxID=390640 RepID=A0A7C2RHU3_9FLAO|nr:response regulator [Salinimicrobium catena]